MAPAETPPVGVSLSADVEYREDRRKPYRARVRWVDPVTKQRWSRSESFGSSEAAQDWMTRCSALRVGEWTRSRRR